MSDDKQLAKIIYHSALAVMKNTLNLEELSYRENGRNDPRYKTFKKHLMEFTYSSLRDLFDELEEWELIKYLEDDDDDVKNGYKNTPSGGSGYTNNEKLSNIIK